MARVPYVDPEDLPEEYREMAVSSLQGKPLNVYGAIANNPPVLAGIRGLLEAIWDDTGLSARRRVLSALAVAREVGSEYEWHQQAKLAGSAGIEDGELDAIADGRFGAFDPPEEALLRFVVAAARGDVDDGRHDALREHFPDDRTVVGIVALAGVYVMLARLLAALDVGIESGESFAGWGA